MKASLGVEAVGYTSVFTSVYVFPRGPTVKVTMQPKPRAVSFILPTCFPPSLSPSLQKMCAQIGYCKTIYAPAPASRASLPLHPGFDRDLGWLLWQGTYRVTQIYLQHSSISLHTRCCWLREMIIWIASERTIIPSCQKRKKEKPPSALNITFLRADSHPVTLFLSLCNALHA